MPKHGRPHGSPETKEATASSRLEMTDVTKYPFEGCSTICSLVALRIHRRVRFVEAEIDAHRCILFPRGADLQSAVTPHHVLYITQF